MNVPLVFSVVVHTRGGDGGGGCSGQGAGKPRCGVRGGRCEIPAPTAEVADERGL